MRGTRRKAREIAQSHRTSAQVPKSCSGYDRRCRTSVSLLETCWEPGRDGGTLSFSASKKRSGAAPEVSWGHWRNIPAPQYIEMIGTDRMQVVLEVVALCVHTPEYIRKGGNMGSSKNTLNTTVKKVGHLDKIIFSAPIMVITVSAGILEEA
jgi:hypothetical protein